MRPGQVERRTHDYKRCGTTTPFAALNTATGVVIGTCMKRHRAREFRAFLDEVEQNGSTAPKSQILKTHHQRPPEPAHQRLTRGMTARRGSFRIVDGCFVVPHAKAGNGVPKE